MIFSKFVKIVIFIFFLASCSLNDDVEIDNEAMSYNLANQEFSYVLNLDQDLELNSEIVKFNFGSKIKLNQFQLKIIADEIHFDNTQITAFNEDEFNDCEKHGLNGGNVIIIAKKIIGNPNFQLRGQNAGKNGFGYNPESNNGELYFPDDRPKKKGHLIINECERSRPMTAATVNEYWKYAKFNGGNSSNFYLSYDANIEGFNPSFFDDLSRGSPVSYIGYAVSKKLSWSGVTQKGDVGKPSIFCLLNDRFEKCFSTYEELMEF
jgi:hypothetical protein